MKVHVVLKGALADSLPQGRGILDLPEDSTVQAVLPSMGLPHAHCVFVINGSPVDRNAKLREGCRVEVYPPMAGGG